MDLIDIVAATATPEELVRLLHYTEKQRQKLQNAVQWALGEAGSDFGEHKPAKPSTFWWRAELRSRAGL